MRKLFALFLLFFISLHFSAANFPFAEVHPYHVGSVEFIYDPKTQTFQISGKFFLDDLENALKQKFGKAVHFNDEKYRAQINSYLTEYCSEYLKLKADNKFLKTNYLGYEEDSEAVNIYLESEKTATPKKVEIAVSFLYNLFDDQMNIVHVIVGGQRRSERLNYPDRYLYQNF